MMTPRFLRTALRQLALLLLLTAPALSQAQILQLPGNKLGELVGQPAAIYSFFAFKDGRFEPVPHEWLAYSNEGFPYCETDNSTTPAGDKSRIDESDMLLLRKQDGGEKLSQRTAEQLAGELRVTTPDGERYFYVVKNAYRQATQRYVKFDAQKMVIK